MKKILFCILIIWASSPIYAQTTIDTKITEIQNFLYAKALYINKSEVSFWVNKVDKRIEISEAEMSLNNIEMTHMFHQKDNVHLVGLQCNTNSNCIRITFASTGQIQYGNGYYLAFKTKADSYTFINKLGELNMLLNKTYKD